MNSNVGNRLFLPRRLGGGDSKVQIYESNAQLSKNNLVLPLRHSSFVKLCVLVTLWQCIYLSLKGALDANNGLASGLIEARKKIRVSDVKLVTSDVLSCRR